MLTLELYSQYFIFSVTYERAQQARVLHNNRFEGFPATNNLTF
jgi:hypothetical protein